MSYLNVGTTLTGRGIILRTHMGPRDLRINSYLAIIEPRGIHGFLYISKGRAIGIIAYGITRGIYRTRVI
jgi:hypothetical protein